MFGKWARDFIGMKLGYPLFSKLRDLLSNCVRKTKGNPQLLKIYFMHAVVVSGEKTVVPPELNSVRQIPALLNLN